MGTGTDTDNALLSLEDAAKLLGTSTQTTDTNDTIRGLIDVVSYRFNAETGRALKSRDYTSQYDGNGTHTLYLKNWPVSSTSITITINANRSFTSTADQVTGTDIMLDTGSGEVRLSGTYFPTGARNVQVEYSAGYTTAAAYDLIHAAKDFIKILYNRETGREPQWVRSESYEGVSRTFEFEFPWSVKKILDMYREGTVY